MKASRKKTRFAQLPPPPPRRPPLGFHFLVMFSANGKPVFRHEQDKRELNGIVSELVSELRVRIHAYCWLRNEIELIIEPGALPLQRIAQEIAARYARMLRSSPSDHDVLFSDSPLCYEPDTRAEIVDIIHSMHMRPVMLDLAEEYLAYPWTSMRAYHGFDQIPWLTKEALGPFLLHRGEGDPDEFTLEERKTRTVPRLAADAVHAKLVQEMGERSRIWMARSLVAWVVTQGGRVTVTDVAMRMRVDSTALRHALDKYRQLAPRLFEMPLSEVLSFDYFEDAPPKTRKEVAEILNMVSLWQAPLRRDIGF